MTVFTALETVKVLLDDARREITLRVSTIDSSNFDLCGIFVLFLLPRMGSTLRTAHPC